ncbi:putative ribonuclease H-like domain-containing protein [Tanacetum coccineum]
MGDQKGILVSVNRDNGSYYTQEVVRSLKGLCSSTWCSGSIDRRKGQAVDFKEFTKLCGRAYVQSLIFSKSVTRKHIVLFTGQGMSYPIPNIIPSGGITCLVAKATEDEAVLWHRRLGHVNFKNINKLVKGNLVRGLPSKTFKLDHSCLACRKGKQHRASCKKIEERTVREPLELLHMDLFGPVSVESVNRKKYCLVVTDDCSKFSWVFFLAYKDETYDMLHDLIVGLENKLRHKVKTISIEGLHSKWCRRKNRNRTLIEAVRTMLADSLLPIQFWAEAVNTACYFHEDFLVVLCYTSTLDHIGVTERKIDDSIRTRELSCDDDEDFDVQQFIVHGQIYQLQNKDFRERYCEGGEEAFEEERKRIALDKGIDVCDSNFTLKEPRKSSQALADEKQEEGVDYDDVCTQFARIEAISLFLAFASFMGFMSTDGDKSAFLYGNITEEVYVKQPPGFEDPAHPNKENDEEGEDVDVTLLQISINPKGFILMLSNGIFRDQLQGGCQYLGRRTGLFGNARIQTIGYSLTEAEYVAAAKLLCSVSNSIGSGRKIIVLVHSRAASSDKVMETEEVNIEDKEASNVKEWRNRKNWIWRQLKDTARTGILLQGTLNFEDGSRSFLATTRPNSSLWSLKKLLKAAEVLCISRPRGLDSWSNYTSTSNSQYHAIGNFMMRRLLEKFMLNGMVGRKKEFEELRKTKPKNLRNPTSLAQERNLNDEFLKSQGYKNLQKLKYPQMKKLYDTSSMHFKDSFKDLYFPMDFSEKER